MPSSLTNSTLSRSPAASLRHGEQLQPDDAGMPIGFLDAHAVAHLAGMGTAIRLARALARQIHHLADTLEGDVISLGRRQGRQESPISESFASTLLMRFAFPPVNATSLNAQVMRRRSGAARSGLGQRRMRLPDHLRKPCAQRTSAGAIIALYLCVARVVSCGETLVSRHSRAACHRHPPQDHLCARLHPDGGNDQVCQRLPIRSGNLIFFRSAFARDPFAHLAGLE